MKQKRKNVDVEALRTELAEQREAEERAKRTKAEEIADYLCQRINQRRFRVVTNEYRLEVGYKLNGVAISFWYFGRRDVKELVNQIMAERGFNGVTWSDGDAIFFRVQVIVITGHGQPY